MKIILLSSAESTHTIRWANSLANYDDLEIVLISRHPIKGSLNEKVKFYKLSLSNKFSYFLSVLEFRRIVKKENADIIHAHYASGYGTLAMLSGVKYMLSVWGSDIYDFPSTFLKKKLIQLNLNRACRIFSTSNTMEKEIKKYTDNPVHVIPFGVDLNLFKKSNRSRGEFLNIGIVKVIDYKYGIDTLINGFQIYYYKYNKNSKLTVVGDGPLLEEMKHLAKRIGISENINFLGWVNNNELPELLSKLDIFVLTSRLDSESFGVAAVEALACGLPCIVTDVGGLPEVVDNNVNGIVIPKNRPDILAEKINFLWSNEDLYSSMRKKSRDKVVEVYDWSKNVLLMKNHYLEYKNTSSQF